MKTEPMGNFRRFKGVMEDGFLALQNMIRMKSLKTQTKTQWTKIKSCSRWMASFPISIMTITVIYFAIVLVFIVVSAYKLRLLDNMTITSWEDRRSLGLSFAGILAPWLAIIGYILSAQRTQTMMKQNELKQKEDLQTTFFKASEKVEMGELPSIAGIEILVGLARPDSSHQNLEASIATIHYRLSRIAAKSANKAVRHTAAKQAVIEQLMAALCTLQHIRYGDPPHDRLVCLEFVSLDLREIRVPHGLQHNEPTTHLIAFTFSDCWLDQASLTRISMSNVSFLESTLTRTDFAYSKFLKSKSGMPTCNLAQSKMDGAILNTTDFDGIYPLDKDQLNRCLYYVGNHPRNLPTNTKSNWKTWLKDEIEERTTLPPPVHFDFQNPANPAGNYYTKDKLLEAYNDVESGVDKYHPKSRDGPPIPIVCPDEPNNPILGMTGDDEPTP